MLQPSTSRGRAVLLGSLLLLFAFAAWARLSTLAAGLPHAPANDEHVYIWQMDLFGKPEDPRANPAYGFYPQLVSRLATLVPSPAPDAPATLDEHLAAAGADFVRARLVVALLSLLALPATWFLARGLGAAGAWLATSFVATSVLSTWYAGEARPHAAFAALAVCSVACAVELQRRGGAWLYLATGALAGLALATLQSGLACLLPLCAAHLLRPRELRARERVWLVLATLLALLVAWPFYPFLGADVRPVGEGPPEGATVFFGHDLWLGSFDGLGFVRFARAFWHYETLPTLLALAGLVLWLRKRTRLSPAMLVAGAFVLPYVLVFGLYHHTFDRFALPLVPFVALAAAATVVHLSGARARPLVCSAVCLLAALPCVALVRVRGAPDTTQLAARWIESHVPCGEEVRVMRSLELPLARDPQTLEPAAARVGVRISAWRQYVRTHREAIARLPTERIVDLLLPVGNDKHIPDPTGFVRDLGAHWLVLEVWQKPFLEQMVQSARLAALEHVRFTPGADDLDFVLRDDARERSFCWTWRLLHEERLGAPIEIYHLP